MREREPATPARHRAGADQERSLNEIAFVGSFPAADFRISPPLPEVAFVGRSNVGKSTLVNAFVGRKSLARTSQTPGKTRACNVFQVDQGYYLVDMPGYGYARASKQVRKDLQKLLGAYLRHRSELIGVVWLLDLRREPSVDDLSMGEILAARGVPVLAALTKADKVPRGRQLDRLRAIAQAVGISEDQCILTSATKRDGIGELRKAVQAAVTHGRLPS